MLQQFRKSLQQSVLEWKIVFLNNLSQMNKNTMKLKVFILWTSLIYC